MCKSSELAMEQSTLNLVSPSGCSGNRARSKFKMTDMIHIQIQKPVEKREEPNRIASSSTVDGAQLPSFLLKRCDRWTQFSESL